MRTTATGFAITALLALIAQGQAPTTTSQTFNYAHANTMQAMQEIATTIRTIGEIQNVSVDGAAKSLTVQGTAEQLALAQWLFVGMDVAVPAQPTPAIHEFTMSGSGDNVVRLYYLEHGQSIQQFQEFATMERTIGDIRHVFTYNEAKILVLRGTAAQTAMADWMTAELFKHSNSPGAHTISNEYLLPAVPGPASNTNVMRVLYAGNAATVQDFQELATSMRTIADIRQAYTYNASRAIAVRGTADQLAFAMWLFNEMDQPASSRQNKESALYKYTTPGDNDDTARIYYLTNTGSIQDFQNIATQIRTGAGLRRVYTYNTPRAMSVRGTGEQVATAERLLTQLDPADFPAAK